MRFVSYAQNFEDVILNRALQGVLKGFYIDIGAAGPIEDSVTKAFYEKGWRGINIEPLDVYFKLLSEDRVEDVNLNVAIADYNGVLDLQVVRSGSLSTGLSTINKDYAEAACQIGFEFDVQSVTCCVLGKVFDEHEVEEVHFLKIDVEGSEKTVIEGLFLTSVRPWIIVVEATKPNTSIDISFEWDYLLLENGYQFVYFDGLNKFYLADEHSDLKVNFQSPPNIFDNYRTYRYVLEEEKVAVLKEEINRLKEENSEQKQQIVALKVNKLKKFIHKKIILKVHQIATNIFIRNRDIGELKVKTELEEEIYEQLQMYYSLKFKE